MDLAERIARRQRRSGESRLAADLAALSPVAHVAEPTGRGPVLERLLDHLDPVFDGSLPPNAYVSGPAGVGKSALVTALFRQLDDLTAENRPAIHTATRADDVAIPDVVTVDLRETTSEFAFYREVLAAVADEAVPRHGVSTADLRGRLRDRLERSGAGVVVAADHVCEPPGPTDEELIERLASLPSNASWLAVGRPPASAVSLTEYTATELRIEPYRREALVDVLAARASVGLTRQALDHDQTRRIAEWADGDAHDALAALFVAAELAGRAERTRIRAADVTEAMAEVPREGASLGRVLALPANRQRVLRRLVDLDPDRLTSVTATAEAVAAGDDVDLSPSTVERYLYELAEVGVLDRVRSEATTEAGRPPSRVELRFSPTAFRRLYELRR